MNRDRLIDAAHFMLIVHGNNKFDLKNWRLFSDKKFMSEEFFDTEMDYAAATQCGATCCFGGWLALSPEWIAAGGRVNSVGAPRFADEVTAGMSVAQYFDIDYEDALNMLLPQRSFEFYGKRPENVTAMIVAKRLIQFVETGK